MNKITLLSHSSVTFALINMHNCQLFLMKHNLLKSHSNACTVPVYEVLFLFRSCNVVYRQTRQEATILNGISSR